MTETEIRVCLENHEQHIKSLQHQVDDLKAVQLEIRTMSKTLVELTNEIKHTNANMTELKQKVEVIEEQPKARLSQIVTAIIAALAGAGVSAAVGLLVK